ncbi:MAG: hypothetical protein ACLQB1_24755 [Streptosporangiaceae bacterium]
MAATIRNQALVTRTLLRNCVAALQETDSLTIASFMDLCSLFESCVILDDVKFIDSVDTLPDNGLIDRLTAEGIISPLPIELSTQDLSRLPLIIPEDLADRFLLPLAASRGRRLSDPLAARHLDPIGAFLNIDYTRGLEETLAQIEGVVTYPSFEGPTMEERLMRSNGYLILASVHGLDYFPDFERAPFVAGILRRLYRSLPMKVYERVAEALKEPITGNELVDEWNLDMPVPIPPISALVLSRAPGLADIPDSLLQVRKEFAPYRREFARFKVALLNADTIKGRRRVLSEYQRRLEMASGQRHELISVAEVLNFSEQVVSAASKPLLSTSYHASLLTVPLELLHRWWMRRPLALMFRLDSKLPKISEYRSLICKHWGNEPGDDVIRAYARHAREISKLMDNSL